MVGIGLFILGAVVGIIGLSAQPKNRRERIIRYFRFES